MEYSYSIVQQPIEDFVRVADEWHDVDAGAFSYPLRGLWVVGDACDDGTDARFDGNRDGFTESQTG